MTPNNDKIDEWTDRAEENTDKWGVQPPADVVLAIMEELAEVTEEIVENSDASERVQSPEERELMYFIVEIMVLGNQIQEALEDSYETSSGNPIPEDERPSILGEIQDGDPIERELDDLAPLVVQLADSIDEYSKW